MPLAILAPVLLAAGSLAWEKLRQLQGIDNPDAPGSVLPHQWTPGQAPPAPWRADRELPNASDCGWKDENGDAHLARWMNHSKGVTLPGDIQTWSPSKLSTYLAGFFAQGLAHLGDPRQILAAMEVDAKLYGCLSQKILAGIAKAPGKAGAWITQTARGAGDAVATATENATSGTSVTAGGGEVSATVGGHKIF